MSKVCGMGQGGRQRWLQGWRQGWRQEVGGRGGGGGGRRGESGLGRSGGRTEGGRWCMRVEGRGGSERVVVVGQGSGIMPEVWQQGWMRM